jgi:hypothetical protein
MSPREPREAFGVPLNERRQIVLHAPADLLAEVDRIEACAARGSVWALGNWSAAQAFQRLAKFIEYSFDGFPFRYPWPLRAMSWVVGKLSWRILLKLTFRPGFSNPRVAAAIEPDAGVTLENEAAALRSQVGRIIRGERMGQRSPTGELPSHGQWVECHLRHAELHLGFLLLEPDDADERTNRPGHNRR